MELVWENMIKIISILLLLFVSACSTVNQHYFDVVSVYVDSDVAQDIDIKLYNKCYLKTDRSTKTIQGKRFLSLIRHDFSDIQFVGTPEEANCIMNITWGMDNREYTGNRAVYGQTGVSSSITTYDSFSNTARTTYTPSWGITGYVPETRNIQISYLYITAVNKEGELWNTYVSDEGDLDDLFPYLLRVATKFKGKKYDSHVSYNAELFKEELGIKKFITNWKYNVNQNNITYPTRNKSITVLPFIDERNDVSFNALLLAFAPYMPLGWITQSKPEFERTKDDKYQFYIPRDFTYSTVLELRDSKIFKNVFLEEDNAKESDYFLQARVNVTSINSKAFTYGLSIFGFLTWFIGLPAIHEGSNLSISFLLKDKYNQEIFEKTYTEGEGDFWFIYEGVKTTENINNLLSTCLKNVLQELKTDLDEVVK